MISWIFKPATPGDRARESKVENFFNSDAVANKGNAIVREGIQNSLDAAQDAPAIRVRISLGVWSSQKKADRLDRYMIGFQEHFDAPAVRNKMASPPATDDHFRFMVFEDFGTSGLTGDPAQWWPDDSLPRNPFFNYFRAEGISDKTDGARGRHGVGRLVFMFASRIRSTFALTLRSGGEELLMGTSVLRNHMMGTKPFLPDGWFGIQSTDVQGLTLPVQNDAEFLADFKTDFGISRTDQNGLSVVVPWLSEEVTFAEVVKAVLSGYFHPILRKKLSVEILDETGNLLTVDADTIKSVIDAQPADLAASLKPVIAMAEASLDLTERIILAAPNSANAPKWSGDCIPEEIREQIHTRFEAGELVALRVPMQCRRKGESGVDCHFDIFLQRDSSAADAQPIYIREGIIVTDVRPRRTSGIRAMVIIDKGPLGTFLGDSENPSHTQWQAELVRDKYSFHRATIDYVVQSVPQILSILSQQQKKPETSLLIDLFSIPTEEPGAKTKQKKQKKKDGGETEQTEIDIPKTLKPWIIDKRENGFVVRNGDPGALRPAMLAIKVAYGVRRGSPFAKYNPADFRIGLGGIECAPTGCDIVEFDDNWMLVRVDQDEFEIAVTGFDTSHRDLHVDVKSKAEESETESQQQEVPYAAAS